MRLTVQTRSGRELGVFDLPGGAKLHDLRIAFHKEHPKLHPDRQRFYPKDPFADPAAPLPSSSSSSPSSSATAAPAATAAKKPRALNVGDPLLDGAVLVFKDLGPQVSWKTVFIIEYFGPLLFYYLFYTQPRWIYGAAVDVTPKPWVVEVQFSAFIAWTFHYMKREFETLFIHRFSNATMPVVNIFKNCIYYWGFAAYVSYFINHPLYTPPPEDLVYIGMCLFYFMEIGNLSSHWTLMMLRPPGTKVRRIPRGGLFEFVSCPNYSYEILAWLGFNLMTRTVAGILFMFAGATQMFLWAQAKHRRYKREFDGKDGRPLYPPNRKSIVPFII